LFTILSHKSKIDSYARITRCGSVQAFCREPYPEPADQKSRQQSNIKPFRKIYPILSSYPGGKRVSLVPHVEEQLRRTSSLAGGSIFVLNVRKMIEGLKERMCK
jgi:hypothetical protein